MRAVCNVMDSVVGKYRASFEQILVSINFFRRKVLILELSLLGVESPAVGSRGRGRGGQGPFLFSKEDCCSGCHVCWLNRGHDAPVCQPRFRVSGYGLC